MSACSSSTTSTGAVPDGGAPSDTDGGDASCKLANPASQTLSQPCCTGWGADACGALLFCAAFDGRTQTTCYPEGSRKGGETCAADKWCVSKECAADGKCRSTGNDTCDQATGCASVNGTTYGCTAGGSCKACDAQATDPRCPVACKGQDAEWGSTACRLCESSACCAELAACTASDTCASKTNTLLSCGGASFKSCVDISFADPLEPKATALKQCFTTALTSCASCK